MDSYKVEELLEMLPARIQIRKKKNRPCGCEYTETKDYDLLIRKFDTYNRNGNVRAYFKISYGYDTGYDVKERTLKLALIEMIKFLIRDKIEVIDLRNSVNIITNEIGA